MERSAPATEVSGKGRQRHFSVRRNSPLFKLDAETILKLDSELTSSSLQILSKLVLFLSFMSEPIYIGMTKGAEGLRGRLTQHLAAPKDFDDNAEWNGAFNSRIAATLDDPSYLKQCLIAYLPVPTEELGDDTPRIIEHILIKTICPALSRRG